MSTKGDVSDFLKLGAQYELILAGLFDELTTQRKVTTDLQEMINKNVSRQRLMNKFMLLYIVVSAASVLVFWLTKF